MRLSATDLLIGAYGLAAVGTAMILGMPFGYWIIYGNPVAGVGVWIASIVLFVAGLLAFDQTRSYLADAYNLELSRGATALLVGSLTLGAIGLFTLSVVTAAFTPF